MQHQTMMSSSHEQEQEQEHHDRRLSALDLRPWNGTLPIRIPPENNMTTTTTTTRRWTLIHIPKTAGDSFMQDAPLHMPIGMRLQGNVEKSFSTTEHKFPMVTFLREPTAHVLSQFLECKYDKWGMDMTRRTNFPGNFRYLNVMDGFDEWIQHFVTHAQHPEANLSPFPKRGSPHYGPRVAFNCYDPYNMMSRYFTMTPNFVGVQTVHCTHQPSHRFPNIDLAIQNLKTLQVVGIVEYYSASVCLWEYHVGGGQFLTHECQVCVEEEDENNKEKENHDHHNGKLLITRNQTHDKHSVPPHSVKMISNATLKFIQEEMTRVDQQFYQAGRKMFFRAIEKVYNETGMDLLCRPEYRRQRASNSTATTTDAAAAAVTTSTKSSSSSSTFENEIETEENDYENHPTLVEGGDGTFEDDDDTDDYQDPTMVEADAPDEFAMHDNALKSEIFGDGGTATTATTTTKGIVVVAAAGGILDTPQLAGMMRLLDQGSLVVTILGLFGIYSIGFLGRQRRRRR